MSNGGVVTVSVEGRDVNLVALLTRMEGALRRTDQVGIQLASTVGTTFTQAQQRAANAAITEAQALARAAVAAGDDARAHSILVGALGNSAAANDRNVASLTTSINRLQTGSTAAAEFGGAFKSGLLGIVGPAAAAGAALGAVSAVGQSFIDAFNFKAQLDATTASINAQLKGVRDVGQVYSSAAAFGREFKLTQEETTNAISASIGVMRASKAPVEDILGVLARMQVLSPEQSLQEAAIALKALASGDTTSLVTRFEVGRDVANQMKAEIQGGADAVQVMSRFLTDTGIGMDTLAARATGAAGALKDAAIAAEELKLAQADFAQGPGLVILNEKIAITRGATRLLSGDTQTMAQSFVHAGQQGSAAYQGLITGLGPLGPLIDDITRATGGHVAATQAEAAAAQQAAPAIVQLGAAMDAERTATADAAAIRQVGALTMDAERQAAAQTSQALLDLQAATIGSTTSLVDHIAQQQASQIAGQQLSQVQATLASLGAAVAGGLQTAGNAALVLAQQYGIAYGAALDLINAQAQLAQAKVNAAALSDQRAGERDAGSSRTSAEITLEANAARLRAASLKRREESDRRSLSAGRASGAAKLSDQTKLNNQLLTDQEKYQDQAEQAEREHQERLLDIQREAAKRQLAQQKKNEVDKRESELGFLESITASELNATQEGRDAIAKINERYYADFDKAQKAAQAGNAAQSEAMVKAAGERAAAEQRYAEQIEQARQDENESEIARLEALREKQRQILDEKDKQIAESGDANVNQTNDALAAEQARYEEQTGKIGTAAEQAAERKVNAAVRSGKAVSDETALLREQETILNRMGRTAAPGTTEAGAAAAPSAAAAAPPQGAIPDANAGILGVLESIASAVREAKDAITREQSNTTSAVKGLGSRLVT